MAAFAFTLASIKFFAVYFIIIGVLIYLWWDLWHSNIKNAKYSGKKTETFFMYCLGPVNKARMFCNWFVVIVFLFNIFRLICTIIFGFAPPVA